MVLLASVERVEDSRTLEKHTNEANQSSLRRLERKSAHSDDWEREADEDDTFDPEASRDQAREEYLEVR